jgi:hypothetical protein
VYDSVGTQSGCYTSFNVPLQDITFHIAPALPAVSAWPSSPSSTKPATEAEVAAGLLSGRTHADMVDGMGRNILTLLGVSIISAAMTEIRRRCNNNSEINSTGIPDFSIFEIGDYIDGLNLSGIAAPTSGTAPQAWNDTYKNNRIVVSGFNTFKNIGDTENTKNHIVFTFRNCIALGRMNSSDTNTGGYAASELRTWLEGASGDGSGTFATGLKTALGSAYLYTIRKIHSTKKRRFLG